MLRACLRVAGDWLAICVDARPYRLAAYPWQGAPPSFADLVAMLASEGVRRLVVSHWSPDAVDGVARDIHAHDLELQLAGGANDSAGVDVARAAGADALILGEALFTGAIDYQSAMQGVTVNG